MVLHPPPPPRIIQVVIFRQKSKQVIFWQNHLIFRQALEKTLGHESTQTSASSLPPNMKQVLCAYEIMKCDKYQPGWILIHREGRRRHVDHIRPLLGNTVTQGNLEEQSKIMNYHFIKMNLRSQRHDKNKILLCFEAHVMFSKSRKGGTFGSIVLGKIFPERAWKRGVPCKTNDNKLLRIWGIFISVSCLLR